MLCSAILFCTFPEIQGVGYRKNPVREGRSAYSVWGLENPLGGMEGKRQGLSYFLSFFLFSPSFEIRVALGGLYPPWSVTAVTAGKEAMTRGLRAHLCIATEWGNCSCIWCPRVTQKVSVCCVSFHLLVCLCASLLWLFVHDKNGITTKTLE